MRPRLSSKDSLPLSAVAVLLFSTSLAPALGADAPAGGSGVSNTTSTSCGWANPCTLSTKPCCSEYLFCGTGSACQAGCDPNFSLAGYCTPTPVCASNNYTFADTSRIQLNSSQWMGDASPYDFTLDHQDNNATSIIQNGELALILTEAGGGTRVSTTRTMLYGNVTASIKTVGLVGIVTAFITMSGTKDEIDWEFTGNLTDQGQTNYYWEGDVADYTHGGTAVAKNRASSYNEYGLVWTPDELLWTVNGATVRTLKASNTTEDGLTKFPQTPSRVQFSVWPAGIATEAAGTVTWAGGMIDWTDPSYVSQGYFAAYVQWVNIECYDDSSLTFVSQNATSSNSTSRLRARDLADDLAERGTFWERDNTINSYVYGANNSAGQMSVFSSDASTIINSGLSTGQNMTITTNGKTTSTGSNVGTGSSSTSDSSTSTPNWWTKMSTAEHAGIIVGACVAFLFILVTLCTCIARSKDRKAYAQVEADNRAKRRADNIPLVGQKSYEPKYSPEAEYPPRRAQFGNQPSANNSAVSFASQDGRPTWPDERQGPGNYQGGGYGSYGAVPQYGAQQQQGGYRR